ncbi:MAG: poly(A) polymerase [Pseudomonadota bacterium]
MHPESIVLPQFVSNPAENLPPRIIPRPEHPISRKDIDPDALKVLYRLKHHGFLAYLVGGSVRDLFLGKRPKDFDIATDARPSQIKDLFGNSRLIGKRFRLVQVVFRGGKVVEVSTFRRRSEFEEEECALASNNSYGTPSEDAWRRDLTVNALFYNIEDFSVVDYVGGVQDLKEGIIRIVGDPDIRLARDPGRIIRALRHAARTGFVIEEKTFRAIEKHRDGIWLCPISRIRDEWLKDFMSESVAPCIHQMIKTKFLYSLFPFYEPVLQQENNVSFLLSLLARMDELHSQGVRLDETFKFALFLLPWFHFSYPGDASASKPLSPWFTEAKRQAVHSVLGAMDIKRSVRENAAYILAAQSVLSDIIDKEELPHRLRPRRYPVDAIKLFLLASEARGVSFPPESISLLYRGARGSRKGTPMPRPKKTRKRFRPKRTDPAE